MTALRHSLEMHIQHIEVPALCLGLFDAPFAALLLTFGADLRLSCPVSACVHACMVFSISCIRPDNRHVGTPSTSCDYVVPYFTYLFINFDDLASLTAQRSVDC